MNKELLDKWLAGRKNYYDADMLLRFNKDMDDKIRPIRALMDANKNDVGFLLDELSAIDPAAIKRYIDYTENKIYCISETIMDLLKKFYSEEKPLDADKMIHNLTNEFKEINKELEILISVTNNK